MPLWLMQSIDYWIGVPLCWICSGIEFLRVLFFPDLAPSPKRMLLVELSEMGSTMIAYPAIKQVVEKLGAENVFFMIFDRNREGIDLLRVIPKENVITINDRSLTGFFASTFKALWQCRQLRIDSVSDLEIFSRCTALLCWLSGAKKRSGLSTFCNEGLYRGALFTHPVLYSPHHHMSNTYASLVEALFVEDALGFAERPLLKRLDVELAPLPRFTTNETVRAKAAKLLPEVNRPVVVLNPDPGLLPLRAWPTESFAALASRILELKPNAVVAVSGVRRSKPLAQKILQNIPPQSALDLTGATDSLEELVAVLEKSKVLVTIDSGPAHFSGLVDIHRIVLFGPETPFLYKPLGENLTVMYTGLRCSPCFAAANHRTSVCRNNLCLQTISVESVAREVEKQLA